MGIFDSNKKHYLNFFIHLTDPDEVAELQAQYPDGVNRAPYDAGPPPGGAAIEFAAPWRGYTEPAASQAPFSWSPWSGTGEQDGPYPLDVATFQRKTGGFLGIGGTTVRYYWMGQFVLAGDPAGDTDTPAEEQAEIGKRRWIEGFETPQLGPYTSLAGMHISRDASRHVGGLGLAMRGNVNASGSITLNVYDSGLTTARSWERFYFRLRALPASTVYFWRNRCLPSSGVGVVLGITATGQLAVYHSDSTNALTLVSVVSDVVLEPWTGLADHDAWHRFDLLIDTGDTSPATMGTFRIYVDGELVGSFAHPMADSHLSSMVGNVGSTANDCEYDIDDWMNAEIPSRLIDAVETESLTSKDWLNGSKIAIVRATGYHSDHNAAAWTGDFRTLLQNHMTTGSSGFTPGEVVSTTSGAVMAIETDSEQVIDGDPGAIGCAALLVTMLARRGSSNGTLGYSLAGAAAVMTAISQLNTLHATSVLYSANTTTVGTAPAFPTITPIVLRHTKGADVTQGAVASLFAQAELIGKFGPEDYVEAEREAIPVLTPGGTGQHNGPYPRSPWAQRGTAAPIAPYIVKGGTYVGNGTGQDVTFRAPVHWFFVRPLTSPQGGYFWHSTMLGSHRAWREGMSVQVTAAEEDVAFVGGPGEDVQQQTYRLRIAGSDSQINAIGVTYQYIAVMDPGMRYMLNGTMSHKTSLATAVNPLIVGNFEPGFAFFFPESPNAVTTIRMYAKGPGNLADQVAGFAGAAVNGASFQEGSITTLAALHNTGPGDAIPYSAWRNQDGNQDTGEPGVVNYGSYTGDGSASRTINLAPASGKRPLFAMVFPSNGGNGYTRDPSHTSTNSSPPNAADLTTGITAGGIDSFTVGSALNTNAVIYSYFVLFADATAGNNGWGVNGEYAPVEPTSPADGGPWPDEPDEPTDEPEEPGGGGDPTDPWNPIGDPDSPTDFTECPIPSTSIANRALGRVGVSKQLANVATDDSQEAAVCRLHYGVAVNTTLRDFPWPFATKYATLNLVAGTALAAVNGDWQYSYREPSDCVFARRIVRPRGGAVDPTPPPFGLGRDASGPLLYCNVANAALEYTARLACAANSQDVLFREALIWRLAANIGPALSRMPETVKMCLENYSAQLTHAEAIHKPGNPGALDTTADPDSATKKIIVNRALLRIGARTIADYLTDQSREAQAARLIFEEEYLSVLRDFPWAFATRYATPTLVAGAFDTPVSEDWVFSYRVPDDFLFARRLVNEYTRRGFDPNPSHFKLGSDATGGLIYGDIEDAVLEYTAEVELEATDALFRDALAWRLAAALAPSLASVDPSTPEQLGRGPDPSAHTEPGWRQPRPDQTQQLRLRVAQWATANYYQALAQAKVASANEQQQEKGGDADWITGRN